MIKSANSATECWWCGELDSALSPEEPCAVCRERMERGILVASVADESTIDSLQRTNYCWLIHDSAIEGLLKRADGVLAQRLRQALVYRKLLLTDSVCKLMGLV